MFGKRSDGKLVKPSDPMFTIIPLIMKRRSDAQVFYEMAVKTEAIDKYIFEKRANGIKINYMDVILASIVRVIALRPQINRFIAGGRLYQRNNIQISFAVKKALNTDAPETIVKLEFEGNETLTEVAEKIHEVVALNKQEGDQNDTDAMVKILQYVPFTLVRAFVGFAKWLDFKGIMPKFLINLSPFHTSAFFSNLGSINLDYIYHHIYDFGTTSLFITMGRRTNTPVIENGEIKVKKCTNIGIVVDERICDGFYLSSTLRIFERIFKDPYILDERPNVTQSEKILNKV